MFDKVSEAAERLATNVSRRAFLGRLGQGALATVGVLAGLLAISPPAMAGTLYKCGAKKGKAYGCDVVNCLWDCSGTLYCTACTNGYCSPPTRGCTLIAGDSCCQPIVP